MERRSGSRSFLLVLTIALTACPSHPRPTPVVPTDATVTIAYPYEPPTLDPFTFAGHSPATRDIVRLLWSGFVHADGSPWLLDSAPVLSGQSAEITLRAGARWSDGSPVTISDVRATWERARTELGGTYSQIARIEQLSSKRARIVFTAAAPEITTIFSDGLGVMPAHSMPTAARWPVSGGPYVLRAWHRGFDAIFDRNPHAWPAQPPFAHVRIVFVPDAAGALELLRTGKVDVLGPYVAPDWKRRASDAGATVISDASLSTTLGLAFGRALSRVERSRLSLSFDLVRIVRGIVQDEGEGFGGGASSATAPKGPNIKMTLAYVEADDLTGVVARAIQFQSRAAGIDVQPIGIDATSFWTSWLSGPRMQAALILSRGAYLLESTTQLYRVAVSLAARPGVICGGFAAAHLSGSDGPFWNVAAWQPCA